MPMPSMDRRDAIQLAMSTHLIYQAHRDPSAVPTEEELTNNLHTEAWEDLLDALVRAAHPLVSEDGTWNRVLDDQVIVEHVSLDDVLAAARYAKIQVEAAAAGDYALGRAVSDALRAASSEILTASAEVLRQAIAAERGL